MSEITLRCRSCRREKPYARGIDPSIPECVAVIVMDVCPVCDRGDFGGETWLDTDGNEVAPE